MIFATFEKANLPALTISKIMAHGRYRYLEKFPSLILFFFSKA